jgi:hypothetical protein
VARLSLKEETRLIYDRFVAGSIDEDQARRMLEIAEAGRSLRP